MNLIVGTTDKYTSITMSFKKAVSSQIKKGAVIAEGLLDQIEMVLRSYDPCFGYATHTLPDQMPLDVSIRDARGEVLKSLKRDLCAR